MNFFFQYTTSIKYFNKLKRFFDTLLVFLNNFLQYAKHRNCDLDGYFCAEENVKVENLFDRKHIRQNDL